MKHFCANLSDPVLKQNALRYNPVLKQNAKWPGKQPKKNILTIDLKYNSGSPVISVIERVSRPGRRIFSSAESLPKINNGLGIAIVSTPKGVMTDIEARKQKVGGEVICKVF